MIDQCNSIIQLSKMELAPPQKVSWANCDHTGAYKHRADTKVSTDYFSLFTFHKIINMWKWKINFKISIFGFGLELNASCNNDKIVTTGAIAFAGENLQMFDNFPSNSISPITTVFTLLQDAFISNLNPQLEILRFIFHFHILMILLKVNKEK